MAKMLTRAGYWSTTCTSKCHFCDGVPKYNKTSMRRKEREQWLEDADLDGGEPDSFWESIIKWDNYEKDLKDE